MLRLRFRVKVAVEVEVEVGVGVGEPTLGDTLVCCGARARLSREGKGGIWFGGEAWAAWRGGGCAVLWILNWGIGIVMFCCQLFRLGLGCGWVCLAGGSSGWA